MFCLPKAFFFFVKLIVVWFSGDDSKGYFIRPTVILTQNAKAVTLVDEIFGPVVTVRNKKLVQVINLIYLLSWYSYLGTKTLKKLLTLSTTPPRMH